MNRANRPLRIAILAPGIAYDAGAIPIRARLAGEALVSRGYDVTGIGLSSNRVARVSANFPIELLSNWKLPWPLASLSGWLHYELAAARKLIQLDREKPLDLVVSHWQTYGITCAIIRRCTQARWIALVQRTIYDLLSSGHAGRNWLMNKLNLLGSKYEFAHSDSVIALHESMREEILQHVPRTREIVCIPNGVTLSGRRFEELWAAKDPNKVLYVGRLDSEKCVDLLLRGFAACRNKDQRLEIIGDGGQKPALEQLATDLCIRERVEFKGEMAHAEVIRRMEQAIIFVLVSASEGMPFVILEAMAAGCAVVCSEIPGNRAILGSMASTLLPTGDTRRLAATLDELLADSGRCEGIARAGFERVTQFGWDAVIAREVALCERIAAGRDE